MIPELVVRSAHTVIGKLEQNMSEITQCVKHVLDLKPVNILEIGTRDGGTFHIWCNIATGKKISVDICEEMSEEQINSRDYKICSSFNDAYFVRGNSHIQETLNTVKGLLNGELVDLLYIDGEHINDGPEKDYDMYSSLVSPHGMIVFHDIGEMTGAGWGGHVGEYWNKLKTKFPKENIVEIIEKHDWKGLGIIKK